MATADGRFWAVYNGEIYNYLELRSELAAQGVTFRTASDTEVLLEAYRAWGVGMLPRLVGMFAFAILDTNVNTVLMARDHFGIKPLYLSRSQGAWLSHPKSRRSSSCRECRAGQPRRGIPVPPLRRA